MINILHQAAAIHQILTVNPKDLISLIQKELDNEGGIEEVSRTQPFENIGGTHEGADLHPVSPSRVNYLPIILPKNLACI